MARAAVVQAAVTALVAVTLQAMPAAAAASESTPQPKYEAPAHPIPSSQGTASKLNAFQDAWLNRALRLQYELSGDVGLRNAPFIGTHNSYNSVAEMGQTISTSDSNQQLS